MTLDEDVLARLPDFPHWRWVVWNVLERGGHADADAQARELVRFAQARWPDWDEMLAELGVDIIDDWAQATDRLHELDVAVEAYEDPVRRTMLQRALVGGLAHEEIARLASERAVAKISAQDVKWFERIFFDLPSVTLARTLSWMEHRGLAWQQIYCPLPNEFRADWARFKLGGSFTLDGAPIMQQMLMQAFTASEVAMQAGIDREVAALQWQKQVMAILKHARELGYTKGTGGALPAYLTVTVKKADVVEDVDPSMIMRRGK